MLTVAHILATGCRVVWHPVVLLGSAQTRSSQAKGKRYAALPSSRRNNLAMFPGILAALGLTHLQKLFGDMAQSPAAAPNRAGRRCAPKVLLDRTSLSRPYASSFRCIQMYSNSVCAFAASILQRTSSPGSSLALNLAVFRVDR